MSPNHSTNPVRILLDVDTPSLSSLLRSKFTQETKRLLKVFPFREYIKLLFAHKKAYSELKSITNLEKDLFPLFTVDRDDVMGYGQSLYDEQIIKLLVSQNAYVLKYAPNHWKDDRQVAEIAINHSPLAFQFCSERLRNDREFVLKACSKNNFNRFEFISERLKNDETIVKLAIESEGFQYSKIPILFKMRKDISLLALKGYGYNYDHLPNELKGDMDIKIAACLQNGLGIAKFYPEIKDNKDIVLELARHGKLNYFNADFYQSLDLDVIEECLKSGISLSYLPSKLICERKDLLLIVLEKHPSQYYQIKNTTHALDYDISRQLKLLYPQMVLPSII